MNFLRLKSRALERYIRRYPAYWLDKLVEDVRRRSSGRGVLVTGKVVAVLEHTVFDDLRLEIPGLNIVTGAGDIYYAQVAAGETPDNDFTDANAGLRLGSSSTSPTKSDDDVTTFLSGSEHALDGGYPKTDDDDAANTGAGANVLTWRYSYSTGEGNVNNIIEGAVVDNRTTPTAALTHFLFAGSFDKTSSDTLKVFVNHEFTGS